MISTLAHSAYQRIMEADQESYEKIRDEVEYLVKDSLLMEDEIIRDFLKEPYQDFYREVKRKTAFALRNYNFDLETAHDYERYARDQNQNEIDLLKKRLPFL